MPSSPKLQIAAFLLISTLLGACSSAGGLVRSDRPVHRRRLRAGRLPGARGADPDDVRGPGARHASTPAAIALPRASGRWPTAGFNEVRFAGGTWDFGGDRAAALVVFQAAGLTAGAHRRLLRRERPRREPHRRSPASRPRRWPAGRAAASTRRPVRARRRSWSGRAPSPTSSTSSSPTTCPTPRSRPRSMPSAVADRRPGARVDAMTERRSGVGARAPSTGAGARPRAQAALLDDQRHADRGALRAVVARRRRRGADRPAGRAAVHPRHPPDRLSQPPLDDADVRGVRGGRGHERALPPAAGRRPDRPLDRLRHADPVRLRHRRRRGGGRVRDVRRRRSAASPTWRSCSTACRSSGSRPR